MSKFLLVTNLLILRLSLQVCRKVLIARNVKRGLEAVQKIKDSSISDDLVGFHQLDVDELGSIASLAKFIKTKFGKLDILVNNAASNGVLLNADAFQRALELSGGGDKSYAKNDYCL
ncbi:hypothetical protein SADUNF_Sadunf02G0130500 [Salix dunnii]|uniref:Uncharacterized protein n=1 Tax=Salix dunnii TaxID=1413687 RepID=A0A835TJ91_9ROSI|nr:hypothetical protein SADUNF_Sadunf02G0130500 [Salix dunnii]